MFRHLLHRRTRRSRPSLTPPARLHPREKPPPWRRPLTWAALITLIASALYFSVTDPTEPGKPGAPPADVR